MNWAEPVNRDGYGIVPAAVDKVVVGDCSKASRKATCRGAEREFGA